MIRYKLYKNKNNAMGSYNKWYARVMTQEMVDVEGLAAHMAQHNTPFSAGAIKGILTDAVVCIKELLLDGKSVKLADLAIFTLKIEHEKGADTEENFDVQKNIRAFRLRARATGKFSASQVKHEVSLKRVSDTTATSNAQTGKQSGEDSEPVVA